MAENFNVGDAFIELRLKQDKLRQDSGLLGQALRDQQAQLEGVADKAEQAAKATDRAFGGRLVETAARAVAVMGTVELALGAINTAATALSGDIEDAADLLKQLPAGIGPVVRQLDMLLGALTGIADETERITRINDAMIENQRLQAELAERRLQIVRETTRELQRQAIEVRVAAAPADQKDALRKKLEAELEVGRAGDGVELARLRVAAAYRENTSSDNKRDLDRIAKINQELELLREGIGFIVTRNTADFTEAIGLDSTYNDTVRQLEQERDLLEDNIAKRRERLQLAVEEFKAQQIVAAGRGREIEAKQFNERIRAAEQAAEEQNRIEERQLAERVRMLRDAHEEELRLMRERQAEAERMRQEALNQLNRTINLRSSLVQKLLREQGKDLQATIEGIINQAENQLNNAGTPEEADLIRQNRDADIRASIRNAEESLRGATPQAGISSLEAAISNLQSAALSREDPALAQRREQIELAKKQAGLAQQQADSLKTVERNTAGQSRAVVGR